MILSWFRPLAALMVAMVLLVPSARADEAPENMDKVIRDYLMKNPDVLLEALQNMQMWQRQQEELQRSVVLSEVREEFLTDPALPTFGPEDAKVTVVEFFDYHCGYCKRSFEQVMDLAEKAGDVKVVFLEYPILSEESALAARAALAAKRQGKYMEVHTAFMNARGRLNQSRIDEIVDELGLDLAKLKVDMEDPEIVQALGSNHSLARQLDISGTPAFIVGSTVVPGANMPMVEALVEKARAEG